ncbi:hypothetical protein [Micavibrio aeruginosavorus]|uniref:hypothetical protein n=1 Tax=Micavibrio aeruginosavorus TaxID=349221 RepID=UPI003F4AD9F2
MTHTHPQNDHDRLSTLNAHLEDYRSLLQRHHLTSVAAGATGLSTLTCGGLYGLTSLSERHEAPSDLAGLALVFALATGVLAKRAFLQHKAIQKQSAALAGVIAEREILVRKLYPKPE